LKLITLGRLVPPFKEIDYNEDLDPWSLETSIEFPTIIIPYDKPSLFLDHLAAAEERASERRRGRT
jgi:hypothetical protein